MDELRFDGQVAIVTGAGGGLGAAHAKLLAARRASSSTTTAATPTALGRAATPADEVVAEIRAQGGEAVASYDSVITAAAGLAIVRTALDSFGRIDIVVANAGISGGGRFGEIPSESVERMVDTHLMGAFNVLQPAWPHMTAQHYGRVVLTTSGSVFGTATAPYVSAKAGVFGLARSLSSEGHQHGIKVNAIMPVAYSRMTAQIPDDDFRTWIERNFPPHKVSPLVALLAHEAAPCTGETFSVGGGRAARVVLGVGPGWHTPDPTPETFLEHFDALMSIEPLVPPPHRRARSHVLRPGDRRPRPVTRLRTARDPWVRCRRASCFGLSSSPPKILSPPPTIPGPPNPTYRRHRRQSRVNGVAIDRSPRNVGSRVSPASSRPSPIRSKRTLAPRRRRRRSRPSKAALRSAYCAPFGRIDLAGVHPRIDQRVDIDGIAERMF